MAITTSLTDELATAWLTGRARIRNYHLTTQGNIHAALRTPESAEAGEDLWEYVVTLPMMFWLWQMKSSNTRPSVNCRSRPADKPQPAGATAKYFAEKMVCAPLGWMNW